MPLISCRELLETARHGGYAVPAFNVENMEMIQAVFFAAEEFGCPVILQTTPSTLRYIPPRDFYAMVAAEARAAHIPTALHLDHGDRLELCEKVVREGYTSVMIDGSALPYGENAGLTARVVQMVRANAPSVSVEAELGCVGGKEENAGAEGTERYTDPEQAERFARETGIDALAVSVGTAHGFYHDRVRIDFERLEEIHRVVKVPLVLHGASGIPDETVRQAIRAGVCKVNFATELRAAYTVGVRAALADTGVFDPKQYGTRGRESVRELVRHKIEVCRKI